jgi:hypothetical protein
MNFISCALNIDPSNQAMQAAAMERHLSQACALAEIGTTSAREEAVSVLDEMRRSFPVPSKAEAWIDKLERASAGPVKLSDE